jgi:DNA-binding transcriptional LysR family regulator
MSIDKHFQFLDTRLFKAFLAAAEEENFTSAALAAYMTQSGISQHVAKLESHLGVPLFKRVGKRVALTDAGRMLEDFIRRQAHHTEGFLDSVRDWSKSMSGLVAYAMPASCLLSPHFSMMLEKRKRHPDIRVNVTLAPSDDVVGMVLEDKVDFGFVTRLYDQPTLDFKLFCQEEYILVSGDPAQFASLDAQSLMQKPFIIYPGVDVYYSHC